MMSMIFFMFSWFVAIYWFNVSVWLNLYFYIFFLTLSMAFCSLGCSTSFLGWEMGMDTLSFSLVILTVWLLILMMSSSYSILISGVSSSYFLMMLNMLLLFLIFSFSMLNFLGFYFFLKPL